jgi:hypothetical protein
MSTIYTYRNIRDIVGQKKKVKENRKYRNRGKATGKALDRKENSAVLRFISTYLDSQHLLDLGDCATWVQALGASPCAVENGVATVNAHAVVESGLALGGLLVTGIGQPTEGLEQDGGSKVLLAVPPVRRAGS